MKTKENILNIEQSHNKWVVIENSSTKYKYNNKVLNGKLELQSEITGPMVTKILLKGICELPTLEESCEQHAIYLEAMIKHWNFSNNYDDTKIPIT